MSITPISQHRKPLQHTPGDAAAVRQAKLENVAEQFEAMFLQQILKQMRKAGDVLSEDSPMRSRQGDTLREFHDEALAQNLAGQRKSGIANMLVKQLSHGQAPVTPAAAPLHDGQCATPLAPVGLLGANKALTAMRATHYDMPPAAPKPHMVDSLLAPIVNTWQRGIDSLGKGAAGLMALVEKVIQHESGGRVAVVSPKGARGLMQLMPGTAREMAQELNLHYSEQRLVRDGEYNKQLGTAYLDKLLKRYDGATALAVAAYNAGPGRVDEWLKSNGDPRKGAISVSQWVERIPFKETRNYTRSILADLGKPALPRTVRVEETAFKSAADRVALNPQDPTSTVNRATERRSPAFAQNMRVARKEIET
jgi:soluble lytic murein transglycosylase